MSNLPDPIKIDDIASGKIDPEDIYAELDRLKAEINILRNDMAQFVRALALIPPNVNQQQYYATISNRLRTVQKGIKEYCAQYNHLLPVINLSQIKLGYEAEKTLRHERTRNNSGDAVIAAGNSNDTVDPNGATSDMAHPLSPPNTGPAPFGSSQSAHPNTTSSLGSGTARTPIVLP